MASRNYVCEVAIGGRPARVSESTYLIEKYPTKIRSAASTNSDFDITEAMYNVGCSFVHLWQLKGFNTFFCKGDKTVNKFLITKYAVVRDATPDPTRLINRQISRLDKHMYNTFQSDQNNAQNSSAVSRHPNIQ